MKNIPSYIVAGLIGAVLAGGIMWIATRPGKDSNPSGYEAVISPAGQGGLESPESTGSPGTMEQSDPASAQRRTEISAAQPAGETPAQTGAATSEESPPPASIDIAKLPMEMTLVDQVLVPVPSEIFAVLDKIGKPNWREVMRPLGEDRKLSSREQIALLLGTVIADGFIAVEAEDSAELKIIGQNVLKLSDALGVRQAVVKRSNAILEASDKKDWPRVRKELDGALTDVRTAMMELDSEALAQLVSLGGWLRGTEALAAVVVRDYTQDAAELLHQPGLIEHFDRRIASMPAKMQSDNLVTTMRQGLKEIHPLMGTGTAIEEGAVQSISGITERLVNVIGVRGK